MKKLVFLLAFLLSSFPAKAANTWIDLPGEVFANSCPANQFASAIGATGVLTCSIPAGTGVTSVTATAPIVSSGGTTPNLTCNVASGSQPGCLASADFTTFNGKQASGNYITALTNDVTASGPGSVAATVASVGGSTASNVHAAELLANAATNANMASTIVKRDGSGNFSAGTITASLTGHASLDLALTGGTLSGPINLGSNLINAVTDPVSAQDAATKNYVDNVALNGVSKAASVYGTVAALPTNTYNNGSSGVGATLTGVAFGALTVDGNTVTVGQRILVKNEAAQARNGIYVVTTVGAVATLYVLTRATDFNSSTDIVDGATTYVTSGATLASTTWELAIAGTVTVGTTALVFNQIAGPGNILAGTGISVSGSTVSLANPYSYTVSAMAASAIDWSVANSFTKSITNTTPTFTFSNKTAGQTIVVRITATTGTITWPTIKWSGGSAPVQTANKDDIYTFFYDGTTIYGSVVQNF